MARGTAMPPEHIAELLRQAIREKVFLPGVPLIQEDLAQRFQVSRSPVREAIRILAAEGLVVIPAGGGATVRLLSAEEQEELYDLRLALEPLIAPHVVRNARSRDIEDLVRLLNEMDRSPGVQQWMPINYRFHQRIYALADRPHTAVILRSLLSAVQPYSLEHIAALGGGEQATREHVEMVDAIKNGNASALSRLISEHLEAAKERLTAAYRRQEVAEPPDPLAALRV